MVPGNIYFSGQLYRAKAPSVVGLGSLELTVKSLLEVVS